MPIRIIETVVQADGYIVHVTLEKQSANEYIIHLYRDATECFSSNHQTLESAIETVTKIQENIMLLKGMGLL